MILMPTLLIEEFKKRTVRITYDDGSYEYCYPDDICIFGGCACLLENSRGLRVRVDEKDCFVESYNDSLLRKNGNLNVLSLLEERDKWRARATELAKQLIEEDRGRGKIIFQMQNKISGYKKKIQELKDLLKFKGIQNDVQVD